MADVLEAMGFPKEWCERALRSSSGVEPAVELLLQWQADGDVLAATRDPPVLPVSSSAPRQSMSLVSASTVTNSVSPAAGLDAVVPDAGGDEQNRHPNAAERLQKVQEEETEKTKARKNMLEDKANGQWRSPLAPAPVDASGLVASDNMNSTPVELHIRCSGYPTMKGTFNAGATLKEVRDFVVQELRRAPLQQPVEMPSSVGTSRQSRRPSRSSGVSAWPSSDRLTQGARKTSRYADPSSNARAPRDLAGGNLYFLIPFPRTVFDTEESMETTLCDANLFPRGILTVQFQTKDDPSTSDQVNNPHEYNGPSQEGVLRRHAHGPGAQPSGDNHISRRAEDVIKREQRLKATLDRYGSGQGSERASSGIGAVSMLTPTVTPLASASSKFVAHGREERILEVDGERVRHRELALQAAAKRMTEAAEIFREGIMPNEGETGSEFSSPTVGQPVPAMTSDGEVRFISGNQDLKGKQVADCGPSSRTNQPAEGRVQDVGSNIVGPGVRGSRARLPLPSPSPSRPEKLQRTDGGTSTTSAGANHNTSFFASGHAIERANRREVEEASPSERWNRGSPSSGSPSVSELRIRLEDGSVLRQIFPAYTTLQSVCEFAIPGRFSTAEYGLILPMPGSHFFEGEALNSTLQEVGLVPRGVVHLQKVASRGLVTQGRRRVRRIMRYIQSDNEPEPELEQLWQDFSRHMNTNLTYEELIELEDSIGRVNVGVPEATIANLPTHTVSRSAGDICIVCLSEMVEGEEVMLLPCLHTFHPACIRQWLLQSTCCPTCKHYIS